jgi:tRNA1Val (adenine37-N6)-methyltransferase
MHGSGDSFLGGRIIAEQPGDGFRSGTDAVMLAAAISAQDGDEVLELGSGAGIATLCLAARVPGCRIVGVDISPGLVSVARRNAQANGMQARLSFECADVLNLTKPLRRSFSHVFCNPPFHNEEGIVSPSKERARALQDFGRLENWLAAGFRRVEAKGTLTAIVRADRLDEILLAIPARGLTIFPLWPKAREPAKRVIVQIRKNARSPLNLAAGLVLHGKNGRYTRAADAILRHAGSLALANPRR